MGQNDDELETWGIEDYRPRPTPTVFTEADYEEVDALFAESAFDSDRRVMRLIGRGM